MAASENTGSGAPSTPAEKNVELTAKLARND